MLATGALAQTEPAVPPQKVQDLLKLLGDPEVQKWIDTQKKASQPAPQPVAPGQMDDGMVGTYEMETSGGERFDVAIPAFSLDSPQSHRQIN